MTAVCGSVCLGWQLVCRWWLPQVWPAVGCCRCLPQGWQLVVPLVMCPAVVAVGGG